MLFKNDVTLEKITSLEVDVWRLHRKSPDRVLFLQQFDSLPPLPSTLIPEYMILALYRPSVKFLPLYYCIILQGLSFELRRYVPAWPWKITILGLPTHLPRPARLGGQRMGVYTQHEEWFVISSPGALFWGTTWSSSTTLKNRYCGVDPFYGGQTGFWTLKLIMAGNKRRRVAWKKASSRPGSNPQPSDSCDPVTYHCAKEQKTGKLWTFKNHINSKSLPIRLEFEHVK